ncbi:hypothetical protein F511_22369 [Dorcoceras hygrometricum]|uniref:Uncharacterized protein n=1 Tax=Dorcoceras hygrometricum TaxID=472368 RepID=A0A2Z7C7C6_9LAMI|nr:hypothetical protein F511_22369 [Dorcoceras hygrometricum]
MSAVVWSKTGGAKLVFLRSFDCYQLGDLIRRVGGARRNPYVREFQRQLTREFLCSFELLDLISQAVPAVFAVSCMNDALWNLLYDYCVLRSALENVTNLSRTESPRRGGRNKSNHGGRRRMEDAAAESGRGRRGAAMSRVWSLVLCRQCSPRSSINRHVMGLDRPNGPGAGPGPYGHSVQVHRRGSIIIPIDDKIGPIYTVYKRTQLTMGPQHLRLRNQNFGLTHRIMVKCLATSAHDPLGITDSACKNQSVMVSVKYGPFNTYIPIRSTTIGNPGFTAGRGFNPAGGAPGGG